jgi:hypothetical protein
MRLAALAIAIGVGVGAQLAEAGQLVDELVAGPLPARSAWPVVGERSRRRRR